MVQTGRFMRENLGSGWIRENLIHKNPLIPQPISPVNNHPVLHSLSLALIRPTKSRLPPPRSPSCAADMSEIYQIMWVRQCHKSPMTGNGNHTTYLLSDLGNGLLLFYYQILSEISSDSTELLIREFIDV